MHLCSKIKLVSLKGYQPLIHIGRTDDEAETPMQWPPDVTSGLTVKDPNSWKD